MSAPILKSYVDESGNISVRISEDVLVLTCEEAECIEAEYKRIQAENAKLRKLAKRLARALGVGSNLCDRNCGWEFECDMISCPVEEEMRELGIEEDE